MKRPLVEAILEIRWGATPGVTNGPPAFTVAAGRFYDRVSEKYPVFEPLNAFIPPMPIQGLPAQPQQRYRAGAGQWPLIQLGDGVLSFHCVEQTYPGWSQFRDDAFEAIGWLVESFPTPGKLKPEMVMLRYIDSVPFDYTSSSAFDFLAQKLGIKIQLPSSAFADGVIHPRPEIFHWQTGFRCSEPLGTAAMTLSFGRINNAPGLIWESVFFAEGAEAPLLPDRYRHWADGAHEVVVNKIFKNLLEGMKAEYPDVFKQ